MITAQPNELTRYIDIEKLDFVKKSLLAIAGTILLTLSAKLSIPFWPVETTMQTTAVAIIGVLYGRNLATITVLLYLFEGALGMPVFAGTPAKGIGMAYMMGPTAGFLIGFIFAAYIAGYMSERGYGRDFKSALILFAVSALAIYIPGLSWLSYMFGVEMAYNNFLLWLPATVVKTGLAIAAMMLIKSKIKTVKERAN